MGSLDSVANVALALSLLLAAGRLGASAARRLALSWGANAVGLAAIVGAFAAGLVVEPDKTLLGELRPITSLLAPLFFISPGLHTDLTAFAQPGLLLLAGGLTIAAILGKMACAVAVGSGVDRWAVALGMVPRGEVQLVYAAFGTGLLLNGRPVVDTETYAAIVAVVLV